MGAFEDLMNASSDSFEKAGSRLNKIDGAKKIDTHKISNSSNQCIKKEQSGNNIVTLKELSDNNTIALKEQLDNDTITLPGHHSNNIITPKEQLNNRSKITANYQHNNNSKTTKIVLPKLQYEVYLWLKNIGLTGSFNKPFLVDDTGIKYPTVRKALNTLKSYNIIDLRYDYSTREHYYQINSSIPVEGPKSSRLVTQKEQLNNNILTDTLSSSSLNNKNTTTTKKKIEEIENILKIHPNLGYWRELKLTGKQVYSWLKTADCTLDLMLEYLSYCAFDIVNEKKEIKSPYNYFFRIIEKSGQYPKPKLYKSHQQKRIEDMERIIEEKELESKKIEKLRKKEQEVENNLKFQKMMSDPECDLYKKCYSRLNKVSKELKNGNLFEKSMRGVYEKLLEEEDKNILEKASQVN